jgi:hypothetical protein
MFLIRGIVFSHETVRDWEAKLAPVLAEGLRRRRRGKIGKSWYAEATPAQATKGCLRAASAWMERAIVASMIWSWSGIIFSRQGSQCFGHCVSKKGSRRPPEVTPGSRAVLSQELGAPVLQDAAVRNADLGRWCTRPVQGEMIPIPKLLCDDRVATDGIRASG